RDFHVAARRHRCAALSAAGEFDSDGAGGAQSEPAGSAGGARAAVAEERRADEHFYGGDHPEQFFANQTNAMKTLWHRTFPGGGPRGFTLVEMLVSATITVVLAGIMFAILSQTSRVVGRTVGKVEEFREARNAFEAVSTRLAQATLNTYIDYDSATSPTKY